MWTFFGIAVFEEPHFWDHLFYQLPHEKMSSTSAPGVDIELESFNLMSWYIHISCNKTQYFNKPIHAIIAEFKP